MFYFNPIRPINDIEKKVLTEVTGREKNKLAPTDIGVVVTDFLTEHFGRIMDYNFTAKVEDLTPNWLNIIYRLIRMFF